MMTRTIFRCALAAVLLAGASVRAADCNANGVEDGEDIKNGTSADCNRNRMPDDCDVAPPTVTREASYAVGGPAWYLVALTSDFDDAIDLVVFRLDSSQVSFLRNLGNGTFAEAEVLDATEVPIIREEADLDGDGDLDAIAASAAFESVGIQLRSSRRPGVPLVAIIEYLVCWKACSLTIADHEGDGDPDLIITRHPGQGPCLLENDGTGKFSEPIDFPGDAPPCVLPERVEADLDGDGTLDRASISADTLSIDVVLNGEAEPVSRDENRDGIPDECQERTLFHRGDPSGDGELDLTDPVMVLGFIFLGGAAPSCREAADADNSGEVDLSDAIYLLGHSFLGGPPPADPGPPGGKDPCGPDPDARGSTGDIGCEAYDGC